MSQFDSLIATLKNENFADKRQLLEYTLHIVQEIKKQGKKIDEDDKNALAEYCFTEVDNMLTIIPQIKTYKEKDVIFDCQDIIFGLIMSLFESSSEIPKEKTEKLERLVELVSKERYIESSLDVIFTQKSISYTEIDCLLSLVNQYADEYQRGKLYLGLMHYENDIDKFDSQAKDRISTHLIEDFNRFLILEQPSEDFINSIELATDICEKFLNDQIVDLLYEIIKKDFSNITFYAVKTLILAGKEISADIIVSLAHNLEYAKLTYELLSDEQRKTYFPTECSSPEYLAKSDMVRWLMYPTELGKAPDDIEFIGKITYLFKKDKYYVFKYRSDSDTLSDNLKNKWLIGWSNDDGGTFSNFDEYSLYEKNTISETLKNIKKKLIG